MISGRPQAYIPTAVQLSEELRKAFHDLEDRLQKLEGQKGKATQGKTLLENHLGTGYAVLRVRPGASNLAPDR